MDRRQFLSGAGAAGVTLVAGCSRSAAELDLPEPSQVDRPPWQVAAGMMGLALFSARVLVISTRDYPVSTADTLSAVSPIDLGVAWGPAAKAHARHAVEVTQVDRRMNWRARTSDMDDPGVRGFTRYSGNWHMIPASRDVAGRLRTVRAGDVIRIEGDLVQVSFDDGVYYRSSMSRDDVGDGACEIIRAVTVSIERRDA